MATTIRHVTLKSLGKNRDIDPMKGTITNPFTQAEYNSLCNTGEWLGGYVEAMGYVAPPMMDGMDSWGGSGSEPDGITYVFDSSGNCTIQYNDSHVYMVNANDATFGLSHPIAGYPTSDFNPSSSGKLVFRGTMTLYRHLANNIPVEWAASYNSEDDAVISTDHQQTNGDSNSISGYSSHIHSHPNGYSLPSGEDISTWIGMFRVYMKNVLGRYATDNPNYGQVYHNYNIYIPNSSNNTQVDNLTDYVIPHFKEKNRFPNDYNLYNDYLQHLNN